MAEVWKFFSHEDDYADLDQDGICNRLGAALAIPTVDGPTPETTDWAAFDALLDFFYASYPLTFATATVEKIDHSLLITLDGAEADLDPVMIMGHMDVVPVVEGTEGDWTHDAFSGHVDDEFIWGRGALDMKNHVVGALEAVEYLLSQGATLRRTLLLAFGQDEETFQSGARRLGQTLAERGVRVEFLVDEGDYAIADLGLFGAPGKHGIRVNLAEKGYADIRLTVRSAGGHSSNPFGGTSLAVLACAIDRVATSPWPVDLIELDRQMLAAVAPLMSEGPLLELCRPAVPDAAREDAAAQLDAAAIRAAIDRNAEDIAALFMGTRELYPLVTTTVAPTMIEGGSSQANVMPQDMTATINFRMLPSVTCEDVYKMVRALVIDLPVEVELLADVSNDPSTVSRADGSGFDVFRKVAARYFAEPATDAGEKDREPLALIPSIVVGATDAQMYGCVCDQCLRFSPFVADDEEIDRGVHGTDERITRRAYLQGIRFFIRMLEEAVL